MIIIPVKIYSVTVKLSTEKSKCGSEFLTQETNDYTITVNCCTLWDEGIYSHHFIQCLCHEMNHAAMCILSMRGVNFDYDNQEALCYLQDYLVKESLDKLKRKADENRA